MTTARTIVKKAMQKAGILTKTETPSADEANDGLFALNNMLSSWSNDSMLIYTRSWQTFNLQANVREYTIGPGQTFNTERPIFIPEAYVQQSGIDYSLSIISDEVYNNFIILKTQQGIPQFINYDNGYPTGKIRIYPVPTSGFTIFILSEKELAQFELDDEVSLPPGWERALIYNLAMELAPEYGQQPDPAVAKIADDSKGAIQRSILKNRNMDAQPMSNFGFNIYTGYYS